MCVSVPTIHSSTYPVIHTSTCYCYIFHSSLSPFLFTLSARLPILFFSLLTSLHLFSTLSFFPLFSSPYPLHSSSYPFTLISAVYLLPSTLISFLSLFPFHLHHFLNHFPFVYLMPLGLFVYFKFVKVPALFPPTINLPPPPSPPHHHNHHHHYRHCNSHHNHLLFVRFVLL